ncbi:MAG: hypothetical protein J1E57_06055 [Prevotella sp.]|nr:hypothetical protein [Prevotella sp.]
MLRILIVSDFAYFIFTQYVFTEYKTIHSYADFPYIIGLEIVFGGQFCYPLWYVTAYIWVLVILRFWQCKRSMVNFCIIGILLLTNMLFGTYRFLLPSDIPLPPYIGDNFLTSALPFVVLGGFLKPYIQHAASQRLTSIKLWVCILALCYAELGFLYLMDSRDGDVFLTTPILSILILVLFVRHPNWGKDSWIGMVGKKFSLNIYLLHVLVIWTVGACSRCIGINIRDYEFMLVLPITILICYIWEMLSIKLPLSWKNH